MTTAVLAKAACLHRDNREKEFTICQIEYQAKVFLQVTDEEKVTSKDNGGSIKLKMTIKFLKNQINELITTGVKCLK